MPRKKKEETLEDSLKEMAEACKSSGENNLAIVLFTYLGSRKIGLDGYFASHCQEFAKKGSEDINKFVKKGDN